MKSLYIYSKLGHALLEFQFLGSDITLDTVSTQNIVVGLYLHGI